MVQETCPYPFFVKYCSLIFWAKQEETRATKTLQGGLYSIDDASEGKMFENEGSPYCPVAIFKEYLEHFNPES